MGGKRPRAGRPGSWKRKAELLDELEAAGAAREVALGAVKGAMQEAAAVLHVASGTRAGCKPEGGDVAERVAEGLVGIEHCAQTSSQSLGSGGLLVIHEVRGPNRSRESVREAVKR